MRDVLKSIFDNDYPGYPVFLDKVLRPIFGEELEVLPVKEDITSDIDREALKKANIKSIYRVAQIDSDTDVDIVEVFDVTLEDNAIISRSRVGIQRIIRSRVFQFTHAFMLFHYDNPEGRNWRFSYAYKRGTQSDTTEAKRYTYLFGKDLHCRTAIDRFVSLAASKKDNKALLEAFSVEALSDEFFDTYRKQYAKFVRYITGKEYVKEGSKWVEKLTGKPNEVIYTAFCNNEKKVRDYVKKLMGRITFLHFLQRKGWMCGDYNFMLNLFRNSDKQDDYLNSVLEPLFFGILNTKPENRIALFEEQEWDSSLLKGWSSIPYLNGGLFEADEEDYLSIVFPKEYFSELFEFYSEYNFTVDENDPDDAEVGVDPEMLGKIFENLLEDNKDKGAFYTPKEIVRYMCQESLIAYLVEKAGIIEGQVRAFVTNPYEEAEKLNDDEIDKLFDALVAVKICDPAIGSGAFPMGLLNELVRCEEALVLGKEENRDRAQLKREIIKNNIYGVDIEKGAIDIARLRFWLSLVVDEDTPSPLPNLDYKIMQGNSLLESYKGVDLSRLTEQTGELDIFSSSEAVEGIQKSLRKKLSSYYSCTNHTKKQQLQNEIKSLIKSQVSISYPQLDLSDIDVAGNQDFFLWHTWFSDVFNRPSDCNGRSGFDIVIGNPPYVEAKKLKYIASTLKKVYTVYSGTADLSIYFNELGINLLSEKGNLSYITTNKFFNTGYGERVRQQLSSFRINIILNFEQVEVFEDILVSSVIFNLTKTPRNQGGAFVYERFYKLDKDAFKQQFIEKQRNLGEYPQDYLDEHEWSFSDLAELRLKNKIEEGHVTLKDADGISIYRGVTTGYNPAFIISDSEKIELIKEDSSCEGIIKNLLQGRNIRKWYYNESDENLIFTRRGIDIELYPSIKNHLQQFYNKLKPKTEEDEEEGRKPGNYKWFEILDNTAYYREFEKDEKIIWGLTADKWAFALDADGHYLPSNGYILTSEVIPIKYLLGILNSKLLHYYFGFIGVMTAGGAYTLKAATIESLPIPKTTTEQQLKIVSLVNIILSSKANDIQANVQTIEKDIDMLVYKYYGLAEEEIQMIEMKSSHW